MKPLAMMIHKAAEMLPAMATSQMQRQCSFGPTPVPAEMPDRDKCKIPEKRATVASMASNEPKISPTYSNYFDQFVPNWNSWK